MPFDIWDYLPFEQFLDPNKRIYWPYLSLSAFYAFLIICFKKVNINELKTNYWFNDSALNDYLIWIGNHIIQITVFPVLFISSLSLASKLNSYLISTFGYFEYTAPLQEWGIFIYSACYFLLSDFSRFILHYLMHHNTFLWHIHRMHHTAEVLTPITFFRVHPLEMLLFHIRFLLVHGVVTGMFIYTYQDVFNFPTILGASFFVFFTNVLGGNLRHSHIPLSFGIFERFFVSPKQHQMHHSKELDLQQSNYGSFFAIWDRLFSTWKSSKGITKLDYGIKDQPKQSIIKDIFYPVLGVFFDSNKNPDNNKF